MVTDRIIQQAIAQQLMSIYEPRFSNGSYGYRPGRNAQQTVKDILLLCEDGLTGIKEAISAAFPNTEYQHCIVYQVRNTLKYVPDKYKKQFATDLKKIYHASNEQKLIRN